MSNISLLKLLAGIRTSLQEGVQVLNEVNFNDPSLVKKVLSMPIQCGFEAETVWEIPSEYAERNDWLNDTSWEEVAEMIEDELGSLVLDGLRDDYREWLMDRKVHDIEGDVTQELVDERASSDSWKREFIEDRVDQSDIDEYRNFIANDPELSKLPDNELVWHYVDTEGYHDFVEWLHAHLDHTGEVRNATWQRATEEYSMTDWMEEEYGSWADFLYEQGIELSHTSSYTLSEIAERIKDWASENSKSDSVISGSYHTGKAVDNTEWRVEDDSSIKYNALHQLGAEIISPVYDNLGDMLSEMRSLFTRLDRSSVTTNTSTGLHVTMSLASQPDMPVNKLKMAVLLGDQYALSEFDRRFNTYSQSQQDQIENALVELTKKDDVSKMDFSKLEEILLGGVKHTKFSSINFKNLTNQVGNNLIEFRVGGGAGYHQAMDKVTKLVVRCGATMLAGYFPELFKKDYIKTIYRLIEKTREGLTGADQHKEHMKPKYTNTPIAKLVKKLIGSFHAYPNLTFEPLMRSIKALEDTVEAKSTGEPVADETNPPQTRAGVILLEAIKPYVLDDGSDIKIDLELARLMRQVMQRYDLTTQGLITQFNSWLQYTYGDLEVVKEIYAKKFAKILKKLTGMTVPGTTQSTDGDSVTESYENDDLKTILRLIKNG